MRAKNRMKTLIFILFFSFSCITFAQVQKQEIQLADPKGKPTFIRFDQTKIKSDMKNVKDFLRQQYHFNSNVDFRLKNEEHHSEIKYQKLQQYYKGVKVVYGEMVVSSKQDNLKSLNGHFVEINDLSITPQLSEQAALQAALDQIGARKYAWQDENFENMLKNEQQNSSASNYPVGELVVIEKDLLGEHPTPVLAYRFDIYTLDPLGRNEYYIAANTGEVVFVNPIMLHVQGTATTRYSGNRTIETQQNGSTFRLRDLTRGNGITTWNMNDGLLNTSTATHFTDSNNTWTAAEFNNANQDNAALDAHWGAEMTYDYFSQRHNRNSIDNAGFALNSYVHVAERKEDETIGPMNNAFWDGQRMQYGDGDGIAFSPLTSIDVIAHEIGHGFCARTAGLINEREQGAINEGLSDIWGAMVEFFAAPEKQTYLMGEDICLSEDALRSMSNPNLFDQPDTYGGDFWFEVNNCTPTTGTEGNDLCGIHTNSGVMNRWFFLLAEGGSGTNDIGNDYSVIGIGKNQAAAIVYRAESVYFTSTTNFAEARAATIEAAEDLYGTYSSTPFRVALAWFAVGVGPHPSNSHYINGPTQLTPGYVATYYMNPYYNYSNPNYVWSIPTGCSNNYCWAILSGQGTNSISVRAGKTGLQTISCVIYSGGSVIGSQYISVNVQSPTSGGGGGTPCGTITPLYGVIYPPNPCNGGGLMAAEDVYFKRIIIYDMLGRIVKQATNADQLDTNYLPTGLYLMQATLSNQEVITQKILK